MNRWPRTTLQQQREQQHANRASHRATPRKDREFPVRDSQGRHIDTYASLPVGAKPSTDYDSGRVVGNPEVIPLIFRKILAAAVGTTGRSVPVLFQFAYPNIAVANWVVVVL